LTLMKSYMHTCCMNGDHELVDAIIKILKEKKFYNLRVAFTISVFKGYGKAYYSAKTLYKALFIKKYRQKNTGKQ
jgi:hypothetical protein